MKKTILQSNGVNEVEMKYIYNNLFICILKNDCTLSDDGQLEYFKQIYLVIADKAN